MTPQQPKPPRQPTRPRVLAVDDKLNILRLIERILSAGCDVVTCANPLLVPSLLQESRFDIVITDVRMPEMNGMEVLRLVKREQPEAEVIVVTGFGDIRDAVQAMREGAYDYVTKPFEPEALQQLVGNAIEHGRLLSPTRLQANEIEERYSFHDIVGSSLAIQGALALLRKAAETDATVLLLGESGTGKELFARAVHQTSRRAQQNFVPVNCAAIPRELLESVLFGHVKGAFTSAVASSKGMFEQADGGTIFLDEIAELNLELQVKINRVIQEREIRPVGDARDKKLDVRIIAATNRDLGEEVRNARFREDLYYRLRVFPILLPPLRQRGEDVPLLATYFLRRFSRREGKKIAGIEPAALKMLLGHDWPGNVRELENSIERAVLLEETDSLTQSVVLQCIDASRVPATRSGLSALPYREAMQLAQERALREYVSSLLQQEGGNVTRAAKRAGIERESFHRLMRQCGLHAADFRESD